MPIEYKYKENNKKYSGFPSHFKVMLEQVDIEF